MCFFVVVFFLCFFGNVVKGYVVKDLVLGGVVLDLKFCKLKRQFYKRNYGPRFFLFVDDNFANANVANKFGGCSKGIVKDFVRECSKGIEKDLFFWECSKGIRSKGFGFGGCGGC